MKEHHHEGHKKHKQHPHDKMSAMPQFNEGHWHKTLDELNTADQKYADSEMGNAHELRESVSKLAAYAKKHKMQH
jgi:hypothetical protein